MHSLSLALSCLLLKIIITQGGIKSISTHIRQQFTTPIILTSKLLFAANIVRAQDILTPTPTTDTEDIDYPIDLIQKRLKDKNYIKFKPGKKNSDIFYPQWFQGDWNTSSIMIDIAAPLGIDAFGGQAAYDSVQSDFLTPLDYISRFKTLSNGNISHT